MFVLQLIKGFLVECPIVPKSIHLSLQPTGIKVPDDIH